MMQDAPRNTTSLPKKPETINLDKGKVTMNFKKPSINNLKVGPIKSTLL